MHKVLPINSKMTKSSPKEVFISTVFDQSTLQGRISKIFVDLKRFIILVHRPMNSCHFKSTFVSKIKEVEPTKLNNNNFMKATLLHFCCHCNNNERQD